jgi:hypothetical protein
MKLLGQIDLKTALITIGMSAVSSISTFVVAKGQVAEASAQEQRAQREAIDRLNRRDLEREVDVLAVKALVVTQNAQHSKNIERIESSVEEMRKLVKQLANK